MTALIEEWDSITLEEITKCILSMEKRIDQLIDRKVGLTQHQFSFYYPHYLSVVVVIAKNKCELISTSLREAERAASLEPRQDSHPFLGAP